MLSDIRFPTGHPVYVGCAPRLYPDTTGVFNEAESSEPVVYSFFG